MLFILNTNKHLFYVILGLTLLISTAGLSRELSLISDQSASEYAYFGLLDGYSFHKDKWSESSSSSLDSDLIHPSQNFTTLAPQAIHSKTVNEYPKKLFIRTRHRIQSGLTTLAMHSVMIYGLLLSDIQRAEINSGPEISVQPEGENPPASPGTVSRSLKPEAKVDSKVHTALERVFSLWSGNSEFQSYLAMPENETSAIPEDITGEFLLYTRTTQELLGLYLNAFQNQAGKPLDAAGVQSLRQFLDAARNPRIPYSELNNLYLKAQSFYGKTFGLSFGLNMLHTNTVWGESGKKLIKLIQFMHDNKVEFSSFFQHFQIENDVNILVQFFEGKLPAQDPQMIKAFSELDYEWSRLKKYLDQSYLTVLSGISRRSRFQMANAMNGVSLNRLINIVKTMGVTSVRFGNINDQITRKFYILLFIHAVRSLPNERIKGMALHINNGLGNYFSVATDELSFDPKVIFSHSVTPQLKSLESGVLHELAHRWYVFQLLENDQRSFMNISFSWNKYMTHFPPPGDKTIYIFSPESSAQLDRDFLINDALINGFAHNLEDPAVTVEHLVSDYEQSVKRAIENLKKYHDPDLAQKIFFAYGFFGKIHSDKLWVIRGDGAALDQDYGEYFFRENGKTYKIVIQLGSPDVSVSSVQDFDPNPFIKRYFSQSRSYTDLNPLLQRIITGRDPSQQIKGLNKSKGRHQSASA